jgi:hypothetical protein
MKKEGIDAWRGILNELTGFQLRLADWKGDWTCGSLGRERIEEFLKYWKPGEHALSVEQRLPAPPRARGAALEASTPGRMVEEMLRFVPLYRYAAWSTESDHLFGG